MLVPGLGFLIVINIRVKDAKFCLKCVLQCGQTCGGRLTTNSYSFTKYFILNIVLYLCLYRNNKIKPILVVSLSKKDEDEGGSEGGKVEEERPREKEILVHNRRKRKTLPEIPGPEGRERVVLYTFLIPGTRCCCWCC